MKNLLISLLLAATQLSLFAQSNIQQPTSINADGAAPAASAMLDVSATDKGMLVPRMTSAQRTAIATPATGLLVFDTDTNGFWFYNGTVWTQIPAAYVAGTGIAIVGNTISNTGDPDPADDLTTGSAAGGDLTGTYPSPTVAANAIGSTEITDGSIAAADLGTMGAASGQVMKWNGSAWVPGSTVDAVLQDADGDTKIQVEESPDEDIIRFDLGGTENMVLRKNASGVPRLELPNPLDNTFVGENAGSANTTGVRNTASGKDALSSNTTGFENTAAGMGALRYNVAGYENTALGNEALTFNTGGDYNTAVGNAAMAQNTLGNNNTAVGKSALNFNETGEYNVAIGRDALYSNNSGENNVATGREALYFNTSGDNNVATGREALKHNTTANYNTASGAFAMFENTTGEHNTATGASSLSDNTAGTGNTANGYQALLSNTTGSSNTANGAGALALNTTGNDNTANGVDALYSNKANSRSTAIGFQAMAFADDRTTGRGTLNTAVGYEALRGSTTPADNTGQYNTAVGDQALFSNTSGSYNTANGLNALYSNTTGDDNTANGERALYSNLTGSYNTANGMNALYSNTDGDYNTANGMNALRFNRANSRSTAIGFQAMYYADERTTGRVTFNTAVGYEALKGSPASLDNTGRYNTAVGDQALFSNTTGDNNTASGSSALYFNTTGFSNTASGETALFHNTGGFENTANGWKALYSNTTGDQNTANGWEALYSNTMGNYNTASGFLALSLNMTGDYNTASGYSALSSNTTGSSNTALGYDAEVSIGNLTNATAIGARAEVGANNCLVLGSINGVNGATASVNVGIGTTTPDERLEVVGNVYASGGDFYTDNSSGVINAGGGFMSTLINIIAETTPTPLNANGDEDLYIEDDLELGSQGYKPGGGIWATASDARLKKDIQPYTDGLAQLLQIKPVRYRYNEVFPIPDGGREYVGVLAQDVLPVAPYMVELKPFGEQTIEDENGVEHIAKAGTPYYTYDGSALTYMLVNAVKEQQGEMENGELRMENLERENAALKAQLETEQSLNKAQAAQLDKITAALTGAGISVEK